jgi:hypothetical protein
MTSEEGAMSDASDRRRYGPACCPGREARISPMGRPPRIYDFWTPWGPTESEVLEPDAADASLGVTKPVGSFRIPCDTGLHTLMCTVYVEEPPPEANAIPFVLPILGEVWIQHEML